MAIPDVALTLSPAGMVFPAQARGVSDGTRAAQMSANSLTFTTFCIYLLLMLSFKQAVLSTHGDNHCLTPGRRVVSETKKSFANPSDL